MQHSYRKKFRKQFEHPNLTIISNYRALYLDFYLSLSIHARINWKSRLHLYRDSFY